MRRLLFIKAGKKPIADIVLEAQRVALASALAFAAVVLIVFDLFFSAHQLIDRAQADSSLLGQYSAAALIFDDEVEIRRIVEAAGSLADREVLLRNRDGAMFSNLPELSDAAHILRDCEGFRCFKVLSDDRSAVTMWHDGIVAYRKIYDGRLVVGEVILKHSIRPLIRRAITMLVFLLLAGVMGLLSARFIGRKTSLRVHDSFASFIQVIRDISQQENFKLRVRSQAGHSIEVTELEDLAGEFDRMIDRIEVRDQFLEVMNKDLEERVEQRTRDLAAEREKSVESARLASLGEMASGIAHEINNPLAIIKASAEQLLSFSEEEDGEVLGTRSKSSIDRINKVADRISKIINGLRTFARDGKHDQFESVTIDHIVHDTLDFCLARFRNHGVHLDHERVDKGIVVSCRQVQVSQVLLNLLNNSFDALLASKVSHPRVSIECRETKQSVELVVTDNGPGIPVDLRDKVLLPFFTTKEVGKGTGLGLSISRSIMADHGGELVVESPPSGACIVMRFPKTIAGTRSPAA